ncbi:hypothetical protein WI40_13395 [Burkholderia ubonensis]|uniref:hypothetical protein n=1 Tax=Burkholderia ubonensis TaxID=101571 RepID=UPI0007555E15|nr:hypothetical protein [Burkholderia ubonensis]KUZ98504.1 hypothetical protein WI40_13395 [Burkholderia ubonensis]
MPTAHSRDAALRALNGPFREPPSSDRLAPLAATVALVKGQVDALLQSTPAYHGLLDDSKAELADKLTSISAYAAECMREMCWQSEQLGQVPMVKRRESLGPAPAAVATAQALDPAAANQIGRVTRETLKAVAFPAFVADLIRGTFDAIVRTTDQQMQAFVELVRNVSKSVDDFMADNVSDYQASDWLAQRFPEHIQIRDGKAVVREGAEDRPPPAFERELHLPGPASLDDAAISETLVPAARRRLAETRLQMLSTMVLMGINRIVVTGGKIRATMGFHIDTTDRSHEEHATDLDFRFAAQGGVNFALWHASASTSISYVSSSRLTNDSEINVDTDLTGEVELHFKSDYFPIQRFAPQGALTTIRNNTAAPDENQPTGADGNPLGDVPPAPGGTVGAYRSPRSRRSAPVAPTLRPAGAPLPPPRLPTPVTEAPATPAPTDQHDGAPSGGASGNSGASGNAAGAAQSAALSGWSSLR